MRLLANYRTLLRFTRYKLIKTKPQETEQNSPLSECLKQNDNSNATVIQRRKHVKQSRPQWCKHVCFETAVSQVCVADNISHSCPLIVPRLSPGDSQ